jgi:hypothetical protein
MNCLLAFGVPNVESSSLRPVEAHLSEFVPFKYIETTPQNPSLASAGDVIERIVHW